MKKLFIFSNGVGVHEGETQTFMQVSSQGEALVLDDETKPLADQVESTLKGKKRTIARKALDKSHSSNIKTM